jgi:hypothetical protein
MHAETEELNYFLLKYMRNFGLLLTFCVAWQANVKRH